MQPIIPEDPNAYEPEPPQPMWSAPMAQPAAQRQQAPAYYLPQKKSLAWLWALLGALGAVIVAAVVYFAVNAARDPFRSLEEFPVETFLRNHESLTGSQFKAEFMLEADLGAEMGKGRLFSFRSQSTGRVVPVLVPDSVGQSTFDKGQRYLLEVEVRKGGLLQAIACRKS